MAHLNVPLENILNMVSGLPIEELQKLKEVTDRWLVIKTKAYAEAPSPEELAAYYGKAGPDSPGPYNIISLIKLVREKRQLGLYEAKQLVDFWKENNIIKTSKVGL